MHGNGSVSVMRGDESQTFAADETFPLSLLRR